MGWVREPRMLLEEGSQQQRKALVRKLVMALRVTGLRRVEPAYKVPALVRAPDSQVEVEGVEPSTPCLQSKCSTAELHPRATQRMWYQDLVHRNTIQVILEAPGCRVVTGQAPRRSESAHPPNGAERLGKW
jgi:hypothetical protein